MSRKNTTFDRRTRCAIDSHRKRAKEAGQMLDYGLDEFRLRVKEAMELPCRYCGASLTDSTWSSDHSTPTSRGGSYCLWNVEIVCRRCNETKGALTSEEFASLRLLLSDWHDVARVNVLVRLRAGAKAYRR